jgi:NAD(P)-dependent dehydrogenase (short-subunit alcohol dehydrogenase family)
MTSEENAGARPRPVALVTGGSTGIGLALAVELARDGYHLVLVGRDRARLELAAAAVRTAGDDEPECEVCDVADRASVAALATRVHARSGPLDLLCLNAGVTSAGPLVEHSPEDWEWVYGTVLMGVVHGVQSFVPAMCDAGRGQVLITGSQVGIVPDAFLGHGPYVSAKAAVTGLAMSLRPELEPHGVKVSLLVPANTTTDFPTTIAQRPSVKDDPVGQAQNPFDLISGRQGVPQPAAETPVWVSAEAVARIAVDGLGRDLPMIVTHPGYWPSVEEYFGRVLKAYGRDLRVVG